MSSLHVPIIDISALSIEFMQSFAHPETLNLNLYGNAGLCISSIKLLTNSLCALCSLIFDISHLPAPTHDIAVRTHGPAPPKSNPYSLISSKKC